MIYNATKLIDEAFKQAGIKYRVEDGEKTSRVVAGFTPKNGSAVRVNFISSDDDNDVAVRAIAIVSATDDKRDAMLRIVNECNAQFRYCKFVVDDDNDVNAEFDFPVRTQNVGPMAVEIFIRFMKIIEEVYPRFMKALWM